MKAISFESDGIMVFGVELRRIIQLLMTGLMAMYFLLLYAAAILFFVLMWFYGY